MGRMGRGGQQKQKFELKLALGVFPFNMFQGFKKHKSELRAGCAPCRMIIFGWKSGENTKEGRGLKRFSQKPKFVMLLFKAFP